MPTNNAHRQQLAAFLHDYLNNGRTYFKKKGSAQFVKDIGLETIREHYPLVKIIDLVAVDEFVEKTNLS